MRYITIMISLFIASSLYGESYKHKAPVEKPSKEGFYKIKIPAKVTGKLNQNYADLVLLDEAGINVPFYFEKEQFTVSKRVFKPYKIVEKIKWRNGATVLFVENTDKSVINNIQLQIKNFDVRKRLELAGSDDYKEWYTIKENYVFRSANGGDYTSEVKGLHFPYTDYKYYRIIIYDVFSLPINVMKVGYFDTYKEQALFNEIVKPQLVIVDSVEENLTIMKLSFADKPYFDKLTFKVEHPKYFYRSARIASLEKDYKGRSYYRTITSFVINSNAELALYQHAFPNREFYLIIDNEDNPPLDITEIKAFQLNHFMVTYLENNKDYHLEFGDSTKVMRSKYDIQHFKNQIGKNIQVLKVGDLEKIKSHVEVKEKRTTYWIWIAVVAAAGLLGLVSYKMITEMENNN
jgi:hypothetical protein